MEINLKDKVNLYNFAFLALLVKACVLGLGLPEAMVMIAALGYEVYNKYVEDQKTKLKSEQEKAELLAQIENLRQSIETLPSILNNHAILEERLKTLESKMTAVGMMKR